MKGWADGTDEDWKETLKLNLDALYNACAGDNTADAFVCLQSLPFSWGSSRGALRRVRRRVRVGAGGGGGRGGAVVQVANFVVLLRVAHRVQADVEGAGGHRGRGRVLRGGGQVELVRAAGHVVGVQQLVGL